MYQLYDYLRDQAAFFAARDLIDKTQDVHAAHSSTLGCAGQKAEDLLPVRGTCHGNQLCESSGWLSLLKA